MTELPQDIDKQALWSDRIAAWKASKLSQLAFCEQNNFSYSAFGYWRTRLKKLEEPPHQANDIHFLPVNLNKDKKSGLTLNINHQHSICLSPGFDADLLSQIIQAVQRVI